MSIGPRSRKKRPRNDLDDYLDEVDSRLFCVTRADRQCLHRDLKAHVRELTMDERSADRFGGRYQISMEQLREEIGEPDDIASMYISSVKKKIPSIGLRLVYIAISFVFIGTLLNGFDRFLMGIDRLVDNSTWLWISGLGLILCGAIGLGLIVYSNSFFDAFHKKTAYLILIAGLLSYPLSISLSRDLTRLYHHSIRTAIDDIYAIILLIDLTVIVIIGLHIYLKHFQVMNSKVEVA